MRLVSLRRGSIPARLGRNLGNPFSSPSRPEPALSAGTNPQSRPHDCATLCDLPLSAEQRDDGLGIGHLDSSFRALFQRRVGGGGGVVAMGIREIMSKVTASQEVVTPAKAGVQTCMFFLDSGFRRNDR